MKTEKHNNLFCLCENCSHPIILTLAVEIALLPTAKAIQCPHCHYENTDLEELKTYAQYSRFYANH
jgi:DNA-directed RNA polymerase subunit RPC12/RpoP